LRSPHSADIAFPNLVDPPEQDQSYSENENKKYGKVDFLKRKAIGVAE
jgi:hypothetical protein